jgi:hypothetical protein
MVAEGKDSPQTGATAGGICQARDPLAYVGAALILLALAANEQPGLIRGASETLS